MSTAEDGGWSIGGYSPIGYEVTPWSTLLPALAAHANITTLKSVIVAKMYTYYLTRLHFGQYLKFLSDIDPIYHKNEAITDDLRIYNQCSKNLKARIDASAKSKITGDIYSEIIASFDKALLSPAAGQQLFFSSKIYRTFFEHYEFFLNCAYGLISVNTLNPPVRLYESIAATTKNFGGVVREEPFTLHAMLGDAIRYYPVLSRTGENSLVCFGAEGWKNIYYASHANQYFFDTYLRGRQAGFVDKDGFVYYGMDPEIHRVIGPVQLYPVGLDAVPEDYAGSIRGGPMLYRLPFEFLKSYASGPTEGSRR